MREPFAIGWPLQGLEKADRLGRGPGLVVVVVVVVVVAALRRREVVVVVALGAGRGAREARGAHPGRASKRVPGGAKGVHKMAALSLHKVGEDGVAALCSLAGPPWRAHRPSMRRRQQRRRRRTRQLWRLRCRVVRSGLVP